MGFYASSLLLHSYRIWGKERILISEAVSNAEIMHNVQMWQARAESNDSVLMQLK